MPHRKVSLLVAAAVLLTVPVVAGPASADEPPVYPTVTLTSPVADLVTDSFVVAADVDLKGAPSLALTTTIGTQYNAMKEFPTTVTQANCPTVCHFEWESNATAQDGALRSGVMRVKLTWTVPDLFVNSYTYQDFYYDAPVEEAVLTGWQRDAEPGYDEYPDAVFGTGGTLTATSEVARESDEVVNVTVHEIADGTRSTLVQQTEVPWDAAPGEDGRIRTRVHLDTSAWAEGQYSVRMQPRDAQGRWGAAYDNLLVVRHRPAVAVHPVEPAIQAVGAGNPVYATATIQRPLRDNRLWSAFRVTVDGGAPQVLTNVYWYAPDNVAVPAQGSAPIPQLPAGTHTITTEVLDQYGNRLGLPGTSTVRVVEFTDSVTVPPLVVGQTSQVVFAGTAPSGLTYTQCNYSVFERVVFVAADSACKNGDTTYRTTLSWTPHDAGAGKIVFSADTNVAGAGVPARLIPVTVYAARTATLSAPASSIYGARLGATVSVLDEPTLGKRVGAARVPVTLQRKLAGSTTWATVATGTTDAAGRVVLSFANTANGRLRAVLGSTVPGRTVYTSERSVQSIATVAWSAYPAATPRSGSTLYAAVYAKPYEVGAKVQVQARYRGGAWLTLSTGTVASNGYARPAFRLNTRGPWDVRVVRLATPYRAAGYSTARRVTVY